MQGLSIILQFNIIAHLDFLLIISIVTVSQVGSIYPPNPLGPGGTQPIYPPNPLGPGGIEPFYPPNPLGPGGTAPIYPPNPLGPGGIPPRPPIGPDACGLSNQCCGIAEQCYGYSGCNEVCLISNRNSGLQFIAHLFN